ncbi:MAG: S41 family peptidase [Planctomycetes bacterium]|nr:S41 family peptidase [Planctomycetota bacterium]
MRIKKTIGPLLLIMLFGALLVQLPLAIADRSSAYEWFDPIVDVRHLLVERFVDQPDATAMQKAMIQAMIRTLDDPYTVYVPPERERDFNKELRGTYVGIGAQVDQVDGFLTIVTPMDDSPALEAGVQAGDIVLEIDGVSTFEREINDSIDLLLGEEGTPVDIRVRHLDGIEQDITIVRRQIVARTVKGVRREGEAWNHWLDRELGIGYIRLSQFSDATVDELRAVFDQLGKNDLNGLVFDVRDNPGGELSAAIAVTNLFLREGVVVSLKGRKQRERSWSADADGTLPNFPMVVLINGGSASASEIFAGAVQDNGRAKVLGARSFGKGSVQEVHELPFHRGTLKLTSARYYLPSGRNLSRDSDSVVWGVDPDPGFVVPMSDDEYREMRLARREYEIIRAQSNDVGQNWSDSEWIREQAKDAQLASALDALQSRLRGEEWPIVGQDNAGVLAMEQEIKRWIDERRHLLSRLDDVESRLLELNNLAAKAGRPPLLPPEIETDDATLTIRDKYGNMIGTYRLEEGDLELALRQVRLSPIDITQQ